MTLAQREAEATWVSTRRDMAKGSLVTKGDSRPPNSTGWNDKIVVLKKTTLQLYFKTFIEKINSGNLIMS